MSGRHWLSKSYPITFFRESDSTSLKELKKETRALSYAAFRLYEPKSREGVLGPDLRVLILLEYPGVSPRGSLVNVHGERSGRAEGLP